MTKRNRRSSSKHEAGEKEKTVLTPDAFDENESVLCYHRELPYAAKIVKKKKENSEDDTLFLVHYEGYDSHFDEWVDVSRLMKKTEENLKKQHDLEEEANRDDKNLYHLFCDGQELDAPPPSKKKKRSSSKSKNSKSLLKTQSIPNFSIPYSLNMKLMEDWTYCKEEVYKLPRTESVDTLLEEFLQEIKADINISEEQYELYEYTVHGIKDFFNFSCHKILLYPNERKSLSELKKKKPIASQVYGVEHLLRFFAMYPKILSELNIEAETVGVIREKVDLLFKFLERKTMVASQTDVEKKKN